MNAMKNLILTLEGKKKILLIENNFLQTLDFNCLKWPLKLSDLSSTTKQFEFVYHFYLFEKNSITQQNVLY